MDPTHEFGPTTEMVPQPFVAPTFVASTLNGQVMHMNPNGAKMRMLMNECSSPFELIATSLNQSVSFLASFVGFIPLTQ